MTGTEGLGLPADQELILEERTPVAQEAAPSTAPADGGRDRKTARRTRSEKPSRGFVAPGRPKRSLTELAHAGKNRVGLRPTLLTTGGPSGMTE